MPKRAGRVEAASKRASHYSSSRAGGEGEGDGAGQQEEGEGNGRKLAQVKDGKQKEGTAAKD